MKEEPNRPESPIEEVVEDLREVAEAATVPRYVSRRRARLAQATFSLLLFSFFLFAVAAHINNYFDWDLIIARNIQAINLPGFDTTMRFISMPGNHILWALSMVGTAFGILMLLRYKVEAYSLLLCAGAGQFINITLKYIVGRPRPSSQLVRIIAHEISMSFPSGHVMHYVSFYGFLFFLAFTLWRRSLVRSLALILFGGMVMLIGFSRVYLGAHWPSDVTAAYLGGGLWLTFMIGRYRKWAAIK